ncbi:MAG: aldehyde dehydrogenase family protein, partial [Ignavibacteriaceae bacterium]|nr:aldehyde dehydrogenase family protein [Ignavibacteriaceae bacterium]
MIQSINPANLQLIKTYHSMLPSEVNNIIDLTADAFEKWKETSFGHRSNLMMKAAQVLKAKREEYSELMTLEMGKPI